MKLIERTYFTQFNDWAIPILQFFFRKEDVYESEHFNILNNFYCCKHCLDIRFKFATEFLDYDFKCCAAGSRQSGLDEQEKNVEYCEWQQEGRQRF